MDESQELEASIIKALRGKGYKATPQRIAIGRFALCDRSHPTVQKVFSEVKKVHPTVSLATVYKTIQILKEVDLIQELSLPQDQTRFDSNMKPHINLVCTQCGNIKDLEDTEVQAIIAKVSVAEKFAPKGQRFDIYGTCQSCNRKEKT
jgi:Fur family transcriptional regulator, peroxide stress response regulator